MTKVEKLLFEAAKSVIRLKAAEEILEETPEFKTVQNCKSDLAKHKELVITTLKHVTATSRTFRAEFTGQKTSAYHAKGSLDATKLETLARSLGATDAQIEACRKAGGWKVRLS